MGFLTLLVSAAALTKSVLKRQKVRGHCLTGWAALAMALIHTVIEIVGTSAVNPAIISGLVATTSMGGIVFSYLIREKLGKRWKAVHGLCSAVFAAVLIWHLCMLR